MVWLREAPSDRATQKHGPICADHTCPQCPSLPVLAHSSSPRDRVRRDDECRARGNGSGHCASSRRRRNEIEANVAQEARSDWQMTRDEGAPTDDESGIRGYPPGVLVYLAADRARSEEKGREGKTGGQRARAAKRRASREVERRRNQTTPRCQEATGDVKAGIQRS